MAAMDQDAKFPIRLALIFVGVLAGLAIVRLVVSLLARL